MAKLNFIKVRLAINSFYRADDENEETRKLEEKLNKEFAIWKSITFAEFVGFCEKVGS